jgi:PAS domain S-box-containing protein
MTQIEQILEGISGGFFALDSKYHFTYWNKAAEEGTGLKREEVLGKHVFEIFPNARSAELGEKYRIAMETKKYQCIETSYKDERFESWYDVRIYPNKDGLSVFFQDITAKKRDQREREALMAISHAVNTSEFLDEMCLSAAQHIAKFFDVPKLFVCIYEYDARRRLLHLRAPSLLDIPNATEEIAHKVVDERDTSVAVTVALSLQPLITDELVRSSIAPYFIKMLEEMRLRSLIVLPLMVQNQLQGVLEVLTTKEEAFAHQELGLLSVIANELSIGINRQKLIDEIKVKNVQVDDEKRKTEEANQTLKKFLAMFSHELRTPLNSIVGFAEFLTSYIGKLHPEEIQEFMRNIHVSGKHLQQLINDILDLSKIEAGKIDLHVGGYPVNYFVDAIQRVLQSSIERKKITLHAEIDDDVDTLVVDQTRMKQILVNLVSNALKYSPEGGKVQLGFHRRDTELEVSVQDEGPGIAQSEVEKLFQPFHRLKNNTATTDEGTGLGLAVTKKLVELHGGRIWVESEVGKGSKFIFRVPLIVTVEGYDPFDQTIQSRKRQPEGEKALVLVIEDNQQAARLMEKYLHGAGYATEIARNGVEGIEKAKILKPNLIILDLLLPLKDGWQVMKELKRHPICKDIPIIIVSIIDEKNLGFSFGAANYFVKPVDRVELLQAIERLPIYKGKNTPKVLIIDDDRTSLELVGMILEEEGYEVVKCLNGNNSVDVAKQEKPDVIILDLIMPEKSGFNVAYELKQELSTRKIPIIVVTSMEIDEGVKSQLKGFVAGLMTKSRFTKTDLLREISVVERMR